MRINVTKKQKFDFTKGLILSVSLLAGAFLNVTAQDKNFTKEELASLKSNAAEKLKSITYRSVKLEKFARTQIQTIYEFVPPDRKHFIVKEHSPARQEKNLPEFMTGKPESIINIPAVDRYNEWIYIGQETFYRNDVKTNWKRITLPSNDGKVGYGTGAGTNSEEPVVTTEYKLTPNQFVNQQESDLYEVIISYKYSYMTTPSIERYKYWINKNGVFAKTHFLNIAVETIVDYEYSSNIKIRAPLFKKLKRNK